MASIQTIVERAAADPDFLRRLAQDPAAALAAEGYTVAATDVQALFGLPGASNEELAQALQARLSHSGTQSSIYGGGFGLTSTTP